MASTAATSPLVRQQHNVRLHAALPSALTRLPAMHSRSGRRRSAATVAAASGVRLAGVGSSVPQTFLTNDDLAKLVDTSDEWIASRTGIKKRHVLAAGESLSSHAAAASLKALQMAGVNPEDVDLVVMATSSPDDLFGSATAVQASRALPGGIWLCDVAQFLQSGTLCAHAYISLVTRHSTACGRPLPS